MTFEFFGRGQHKIGMEDLLATEDAILLHVRAVPEWKSIQLKIKHHINVLWIPTEEILRRLNEIPRDKTLGIFCTNGPRSAAVYPYLRSEAYEDVRIAPGDRDAFTSLLLAGKLFKSLNEHRTADHDRK